MHTYEEICLAKLAFKRGQKPVHIFRQPLPNFCTCHYTYYPFYCLSFAFVLQEVAPDHTVKLDRVGPDIPIVRRHGSSFRRLALISSDGSQRHFIVQTSLTPNARSDERMLQLFRVLNKMFDKHKESRRRQLSIPQ